MGAMAAMVNMSTPGAAPWLMDFTKPNSTLFMSMHGLRHCEDVCFEARDDMMKYNADIGGGEVGLQEE